MDAKLGKELADLMARLRELDLKKSPSISETIDWARALLALNAKELGEELVNETMSVILKYEADIRKAETEVGKILSEKKSAAPAGAEGEKPAEQPATAKKGALH